MANKLKKIARKKTSKDLAEEVESDLAEELPKRKTPINYNKIISTGSTLLDLSISGKRVRGGGIPGGIMAEIYGPPSAGKTALLAELSASSQSGGGDVLFLDPEGRLDKQYSEIYGMNIEDNFRYERPDTVKEMFAFFKKWKPEDNNFINVVAADSLAALSTELEMDKEDERGQKRAKDFSQELRRNARRLAENNWLLACSNQIRETDHGDESPGGRAIKFYSSLRINIKPAYPIGKLFKEKTLFRKKDKKGKWIKDSGVKHKKSIGALSTCKIIKSSVDNPFREANIYIVFGYGVHDIWGNLVWVKEAKGDDSFFPGNFKTIEKAILHIEDNDLEEELKEATINLWEEIEEHFSIKRKRKKR